MILKCKVAKQKATFKLYCPLVLTVQFPTDRNLEWSDFFSSLELKVYIDVYNFVWWYV